jgi:DNA-binding XRE family transcriptional regulator
MHLIHCQPNFQHSLFYQNETVLTRPNTLPYVFHKLRIHRNLTKASLAKKIGFTEEYVSDVEAGSIFPNLQYCLKCGNEFDFNPNWVKVKWANAVIERYSGRLKKKLGIDD